MLMLLMLMLLMSTSVSMSMSMRACGGCSREHNPSPPCATPVDRSFTSHILCGCCWRVQLLGQDTSRPGLVDTPTRMAKALLFLTSGGGAAEAEATSRDALFDVEGDDMVVVRDIDVSSLCEHHMLPFYGKVCVCVFGDVAGCAHRTCH